MEKIFLVQANYSDYEWQRSDILGVFNSADIAEACKNKFLQKIKELREEENPLTDEDRTVSLANLPDDRYEVYEKWQNMQNEISNFENIDIKELNINEENFEINP